MYKRKHHQRIERILRSVNADLLRKAGCSFGGGTAISLLLGEYRESVDIDFLVSDVAGYAMLRNSVRSHNFSELVPGMRLLRDPRTDRYGIRAFVVEGNTPVKFEIVLEGRIKLAPGEEGVFPVPVLSVSDLFAEKLLANSDRFADPATKSKDIIDIVMMELRYGGIPATAMVKAKAAYSDIEDTLQKAKTDLARPGALDACAKALGIAGADLDMLRNWLGPSKLTHI